MKTKMAYRNFELAFSQILEKSKRGSATIYTLLRTLTGKANVVLVLFLALAFAQVPGIAVFFGIFITYLGARLAIGRSFIWIPDFLKSKKIPTYFQTKMIEQAVFTLHFMRRWSRPRYEWTTQKVLTRVLNGLMIACVGICLSSCPPVPLTGMLASVSIFLIGIGLLNSDGVYILLGYLASILYFIQVALLIHYCSFTQIFEWIKSLVT